MPGVNNETIRDPADLYNHSGSSGSYALDKLPKMGSTCRIILIMRFLGLMESEDTSRMIHILG